MNDFPEVSYELSVLAQIDVKTSWAAAGFASPERSTGQACWVAKESWWLKLWLKASREIHPAPGNSFKGNRVKDNFETESWHFVFHWVSGVWLVLVTVLQQEKMWPETPQLSLFPWRLGILPRHTGPVRYSVCSRFSSLHETPTAFMRCR